MGRLRIMPYAASNGAKALQDALKEGLGMNVLRLRRPFHTSAFRGRADDVIINWGYRGDMGNVIGAATLLNTAQAVHLASNKLKCFNTLAYQHGYTHLPTFWTDKREIPRDAYPVYCRTTITGSQGRGIVVAHNAEELVDAPLYTQGVGGDEYRFHVWNGNVIFTQQKRRMSTERREEEGITLNEEIRNHGNGYVFACNDVIPVSDAVKDAVIDAMSSLHLHFGAVDMRVIQGTNKCYLLEINTAPGLDSPSCLAAYVGAVRSEI